MVDKLTVDAFFTPKTGIIASVKPAFKPRTGQPELAQTILDLCETTGQHLLAEAPTGFGKSFAALVPAIIKAIQDGERTVISTETLTLQDQYVNKDLPLLQEACKKVGINFTFAVAKGRSNYLCRAKLGETTSRMVKWARLQEVRQHTGDLATVPFDTKPGEFREVGADDDCERKGCKFYGEGKLGHSDCFVFHAARLANEADIVVTNHTLLMIDADLGVGSIFGTYSLLIADEGHTLPEIAQKVFGKEIRQRTISGTLRLCNKILRAVGIPHFEPGFADPYIEAENRLFQPLMPLIRKGGSYNIPEGIKTPMLAQSQDAAVFMIDKLKAEAKLIKGFRISTLDGGESAEEVAARERKNELIDLVREKLRKLASTLKRIYRLDEDVEYSENWLSFLEAGQAPQGPYGVLNLKPIDVAPLIRTLLVDMVSNVVIMSATMRVYDSFRFMRKELGMPREETHEFVGETPFDFSKQVIAYFPTDLPEPDEENYTTALAKRVRTIIRRREGSALVLFTSFKAMREVFDIVSPNVEYRCLLQGQSSKALLSEQFKHDESSCLFATRSFFTGVDFAGDTLRNVILVRAPFRVPSDPMFRAKCQKIKDEGGDDFSGYSMPLMIMDFKQAFGRLIRTPDDTGLFAMLDSRANKKSYGAKMRKALPGGIEVVKIVPDLND